MYILFLPRVGLYNKATRSDLNDIRVFELLVNF
jgi:hypothetical protein